MCGLSSRWCLVAESLGPSAVELAAAAVATSPRPSTIAVGQLDLEGRQAVARSAQRRAEILSAGARLGLLHDTVIDRACRGRVMALVTFIRHCAEVKHSPGDVEVLSEEHPERDLGRQGESRTAAQEWQW